MNPFEEIKSRLRSIVFSVFNKFPLLKKTGFYTPEEVLEEVARIVESKFQGRSKETTFAQKVAQNICNNLHADLYKSKKNGGLSDYEVLETEKNGISPEEIFLGDEVGRRISESIRKMSISRQLIFRLRFIDELGYEEIANSTNMKLGTVKSHIRRIRIELARELSKCGYEIQWESKI